MEFLLDVSHPNEYDLKAGLPVVNHPSKIATADLRAVVHYSPSVELLQMTSCLCLCCSAERRTASDSHGAVQ